MTMMKLLAGAAGFAALATAAPAVAQWGYAYPQGYAYGYNNMHNVTAVAAQRCSAAVQHRLSRQSTNGVGGIVGALLGVNTAPTGRVLAITEATPRSSTVRVRGLATSGRSMGYGPYGVGAYGAAGYQYQPDLSFRCDVDYRGYVRDVNINRRR
jgi:hypothetical protein